MNIEETINTRLEKHLEYAEEHFPRHILGIFAYGSMNYGFWLEGKSDVDSIALVLPSFESIVKNKKPVSGNWNYEGEKITYIDFRVFCTRLKAGVPNMLEILFTPYRILSPEHYARFTAFFDNKREQIAKANPFNVLYSAKAQALSYLTQHKHTTMKDIYNARRLLQFLDDYNINKPYTECLVPHDERVVELLWKMRKAENVEQSVINNKALELMERINKVETVRKQELTSNEIEGIDEVLTEIMRDSLLTDLGVDTPQVLLDDILEELTHREKQAIKEIFVRTGMKGRVSIKKLTEETELSRPVYQNVLSKLRENQIIRTKNRGQCGLEVEFLTPAIVTFMEGI